MSNENVKSIFLSKRFWLNLVALLLALTELFNPGVIRALVKPEHQDKALMIFGLVVAALNIILARYGSKKDLRVGLSKLVTKKTTPDSNE